MSARRLPTRAIGTPMDRLDGLDKVRGATTYAYEWQVDRPAYLYPLQATIAAGRIISIDTAAAGAEPGVLVVLTHHNAPKLADTGDGELAILQSEEVAFRGQLIGGVIADTSEIARHAAGLVRMDYQQRAHDVQLRADRDDLYAPELLNAGFETDTAQGDIDTGLASAAVTLDATYTTPMEHNNPMEPHATIAIWTGDGLTLYVSTQGVHPLRAAVAAAFGLDPQQVRLISPHVGGGFGSKGRHHADVILAAMAAQLVPGRPVKLALTRQQMFSQVGYRTPSIQRIRLGAEGGGRLVAISHDVVEQTSRIKEFAEQTAICSRVMYAAPNRRTTHRLAALDVPVPTIMRAPGEAPGMFALESAIDELAIACGLDPIELRIRNEPDVDPESGLPFSSRNLVACLQEGARRFGWERRDPTPRARQEAGWLGGTGVAAATYPAYWRTGSAATIRVGPDGRYGVLIGARSPPTRWRSPSRTSTCGSGIPRCRRQSWPAVRRGRPAGARRSSRRPASCARAWRPSTAGWCRPRDWRSPPRCPPTPTPSGTRCTASGRSSPRSGCTRTAARCGSPACSACSRPAGSSTPSLAARSCWGG